jgi:hypothetical protein
LHILHVVINFQFPHKPPSPKKPHDGTDNDSDSDSQFPKFKIPIASPKNVQWSPAATPLFDFINVSRQQLSKLKLHRMDITKYSPKEHGIIVNAANSALQKGGGVDNAIHNACQPEMHLLQAELNKIIKRRGSNFLNGEIAVTNAYGSLKQNNIKCIYN